MSPVKVAIAIMITVDPDAWNVEYGTDYTPSDVMTDVKRYVATSVPELPGIQSSGAAVVVIP